MLKNMKIIIIIRYFLMEILPQSGRCDPAEAEIIA